MKIPLKWLSQFTKLPKDESLLTNKLTMVGHMLDKSLKIDGQRVIDLELRGNRADCYSIIGIAREVSAIFNTKLSYPETVELKKVSKLKSSALIIDTPLVKRAAMTEVYDVKITKSPKWLSEKLSLYGMDSVNNIVDLTNYVMIETGEPMHAFDLDKVTGDLEIRLAKKGERMETFQGATITLSNEDLVWTRGKEILSVAGAIGEKHHSISDLTVNILVEAANYDRANIRKSVYRHNLLTEAGIRHEKDLDPNMVDSALGRFLYLLKKYGWGNPNCEVYDYYPKKLLPWKLNLDINYLNKLGGIDINSQTVKKILLGLNFKTLSLTDKKIEVLVPTYRTDVRLPEDLAEEILRIYGYDNIPIHVLSEEIPNEVTPKYIKQENSLRLSASSVGFKEAITLSFVKENLNDLNTHPDKSTARVASLINPPSPDNKNLRTNLLANLYEVSKKAINQQAEEVRLFEVGKVYHKDKNKYIEERKIAFTYYKTNSNSFSHFKSLLMAFFEKANIINIAFEHEIYLLPLTNSFSISINRKIVGFGGMYKNIHFAQIDLDSIIGIDLKYKVSLWPKYPPQIEDITFIFPEKTKIGDAKDSISSISKLINKVELKDIFEGAYTFRIWYQASNKTLTDLEVGEVRKKILKIVKDKFGGRIKD